MLGVQWFIIYVSFVVLDTVDAAKLMLICLACCVVVISGAEGAKEAIWTDSGVVVVQHLAFGAASYKNVSAEVNFSETMQNVVVR